MIRCPCCCSPNLLSNKIAVPSFEGLSQQVERTRSAGQARTAIGISVLWGLTHTVNAFTHTWRCGDCWHRFS